MVAGAFQQAAQGLEKALTIESVALLQVEQLTCHDVAWHVHFLFLYFRCYYFSSDWYDDRGSGFVSHFVLHLVTHFVSHCVSHCVSTVSPNAL